MLILNEDLWRNDKILKFYCGPKWETTESYMLSQCSLQRLKELLLECYKENKESILIYDCNIGEFPYITDALKVVYYMLSIKEELENGLKYTIIYAKSEQHKSWINSILNLYTPVKPVYIVSTKEEVQQLIINKKC